MAAAVDMNPIKFALPEGARYFTPFAGLPVELRHQIWEDAVYEPGMHFLRLAFQRPDGHGHSHGHNDSELDPEMELALLHSSSATKRPSVDARLSPLYPHAKAEISNLVHINNQLDKLAATCLEAKRVADRLRNHRNTLSLSDGRVVALAGSFDVVCLDYLPADMLATGCRIPFSIKCPSLDRVRHLAVRYCHKWDSQALFCETCGSIHHRGETSRSPPMHLYQFLARCFPNLQTFYFIDFFALQKRSLAEAMGLDDRPDRDGDLSIPNEAAAADSSAATSTLCPPSEVPAPASSRLAAQQFICQGRRFHELDLEHHADEWIVSSQVFDTLKWLRDNYRHYSSKMTPRESRQPHRRPDAVQFKALACEWDVTPPSHSGSSTRAPEKTNTSTSSSNSFYAGHGTPSKAEQQGSRAGTPKKSANKRLFTLENSSFGGIGGGGRALKTSKSLSGQATSAHVDVEESADAEGQDDSDGIFAFGRGMSFDFTFEKVASRYGRF